MGSLCRGLNIVLVLTSLGGAICPTGLGANNKEGKEQESGPLLRLEDLERMALENNPTLNQAEASVRATEGRKLQAGLYPNPVLGYIGGELSFRAPSRTSEHLLFLEQSIVTAGKLRKRATIFARAQDEAEADAQSQRLRVLNTVRLLYYEALGAQELVELRGQLSRIAREAVEISEQLYNVGAADRPDVLEAQIEADRAELALIEARNNLDQVWDLLAAAVGTPSLQSGRLAGDLEETIPVLNKGELLAALLQESPEIKRAKAGVERAKATLEQAKAEPIPDIRLRGGAGYNFEQLDVLGGPVRLEWFLEAGLEIPIFDRNQGNIAAARHEMDGAQSEVRRLELALRARLAAAFARYEISRNTVARYQESVLPQAQLAYDLYLTRFQQMAAAYPQVLISQRTLFQVRADYVRALVEAWQNVVQLRGLLLAGGLNPPGGLSEEVPLRLPHAATGPAMPGGMERDK